MDLTILDVSNIIMGRFSKMGQDEAPDTLVPPPIGIITQLYCLVSFTIFSTCS